MRADAIQVGIYEALRRLVAKLDPDGEPLPVVAPLGRGWLADLVALRYIQDQERRPTGF
jgi:hypothetical protein